MRTFQHACNLIHRAGKAYQAGGGRLVARRFHRWLEHQRGQRWPSKSYQRWIKENTPSRKDLRNQREWSVTKSNRAPISIICPVHQTPPFILEKTVQSVLAQTYPFWELCVTLSKQDSPELQRRIQKWAESDERIQIVPLNANQGISENTNTGLRAAKGKWVAFLDHDDQLAPQALFAIARHLEQNPECDLIYTDEDLLSANGRFRKTPMLKPDWSPEMLLHFNYICHFVVARNELIQRVGGLRSAYDGAQDWDLLLRISEQTQRIHHIPQILYHWRDHETSTASDLEAKPYVVKAQQSVLEHCYRRRGILADSERNRYGHYRPKWKTLDEPLVSIIIPNRDQPYFIRQLVDGLLNHTLYSNMEIVLVDNQSTDPDVLRFYEELESHQRVRVVDYPERFNYSAACNRGANVAHGEYFLFLNNDVEILHEDWLRELVGWGRQPGVGIVGAYLTYPDGSTQHAGVVLGLYELAGHMFSQSPMETASPLGHAEWTRNVSAVTGACQLVRRDLFQLLDGYDEGYTLVYSDIELCLRIRQLGLRILYTPYCKLIHHECSTREPGNNPADAARFARTLRQLNITEDPYYHPALSANGRVPQLKTKSSLNVRENLLAQLKRYEETDELSLPVAMPGVSHHRVA